MLRGHLHLLAFLSAIPAGALLLAHASSAMARTACAVYIASLLLLFGTSAFYHCFSGEGRLHQVMQRLDHSMIYVLIGGTYTPVCLLALPRAWGIPLLVAVGAGVIAGMCSKLLAFDGIGRRASLLYLLLGWAAVVAAPVLVRELTGTELWLLVLGGLAYTAGFPVLVLQRPNPWPRVFGYHEIWHVFTVIAGALHFAAVVHLAG